MDGSTAGLGDTYKSDGRNIFARGDGLVIIVFLDKVEEVGFVLFQLLNGADDVKAINDFVST